MKSILILLSLILSSSFCLAQSGLLPIDEQGKFIYYELVDVKGTLKDQLKYRLKTFFSNSNKDLRAKTIQGDSIFTATGKLIINKTVLVMSHPSGEILYDFQAEVKDGKYRFWLTNFNFIPYQRDRYGNFVAVSTRGVPLESDPGKLNGGQWKEYQTQTANFAYQLATRLKEYMQGNTPNLTPVKEIAVVKKEW